MLITVTKTRAFRRILSFFFEFIHDGFLYLLRKRIQSTAIGEVEVENTYNVLILENGWVKEVKSWIPKNEILQLLKNSNCKIENGINGINNQILSNGICRIVKRIGLLKKREFHITGIWDF